MHTTLVKFLAVIIASLSITSVSGQSFLSTDAGQRQERRYASPQLDLRGNTPDTLLISASEPFFDDFSGAIGLPDTTKWFIPSIDFRVPQVVRNSAISPPTPGTIRFDGLRRSGIPYETLEAAAGPADRIVSHYLDIRSAGPSSNFWLYLYVEAAGRCEKPESTDTFRVSLITPTDTFVLAKLSGALAGGKTWLSIPMDQPGYFSQFTQIVMENNGSLNGLLDVWHVDYVYLGVALPGGINNLDEQGPLRLLSSPLEPYFQFPLRLYNDYPGWQSNYQVEVKQNQPSTFSGTLHGEWRNGVTPPTNPYFADVAVTIPANASSNVSIPPYGTQTPDIPGSWYASHYLLANNDRFAGNDTLVTQVFMDSLIGYDDGVADRSFGLNRALSFGLRIDLPAADTVTGVWIYFTPTVHVNPTNNKITYLADKVFRLRIWDFPHPDSFIVEQVANMKVTYSEEGQFVRLPLGQEAAVPATFWIGIQQLDDIPLGVGFDQSYDRDSYTYWDSSGIWTNTRLDGVPMIRTELKTAYKPVLASIPQAREALLSGPRLIKNPIGRSEEVRIHSEIPMTLYRGSLLDLQGKLIQSWTSSGREAEFSFEIPRELAEGLYFWRHEWQINGQTQILMQRLLIAD
ncbi:MAG: hypothetical protein NWR72_03770 [Bacteroidia bacterium]|nr:hypothetical protein [Bacteroidia bacterium]